MISRKMKTTISFVGWTVAKKNTRERAKIEFMRIIGSKAWPT